MFAEFETFIRAQADLCDHDIALMRSVCVERTLNKKEAILRSGEVCRYKIFVSKGLLRTYNIKEDGSEHILQFSCENSWTTDPESFDYGIPSLSNIEALEQSELVLWTKKDFEFLFANIPALKTYSDRLISRNLYLIRQRIMSAISSTPEERYDEFTRNYPGIFARVPLHMVASHLGVSLKTLSRIRHAQLTR